MPEILLRISLSILNYGWCPRGRRTGHEFLWPRELGVEWSEICIATYVSQKYQLATALAMLQRVLPATSEARQVEQKDIFFVKAVRRSHERHQMSYPKKHPKTVAKPPQAADWIYCDKSMVNIFLITEIVSQRTHVSWIYLPSGEHTKSNGKIHHSVAGKIHYFYSHLYHCFLYVHQRLHLISLNDMDVSQESYMGALAAGTRWERHCWPPGGLSRSVHMCCYGI